MRVTTRKGTHVTRHPPPRYAWADPRYEVAQASIVPCCADLLNGLRGNGGGETTGEDNLKTLRLVFAAYDSARRGACDHVVAGLRPSERSTRWTRLSGRSPSPLRQPRLRVPGRS